MKAPLPLALFIVGLGAAAAARADTVTPPPPRYVEGCTLEKATRPGEECVLVSGRTYIGGLEASFARQTLERHGFCERCDGSFLTIGETIYCRKKEGAKPLPPRWREDAKAAAEALANTEPPAGRPGHSGPHSNIKECRIPETQSVIGPAPASAAASGVASAPPPPAAGRAASAGGCSCQTGDEEQIPIALFVMALAGAAIWWKRNRRGGIRGPAEEK